MTKIQIFQLIFLLPLLAFIFYTYFSGENNLIIFTILALINLALWIARQAERRKTAKDAPPNT